MHQYVVLYSAYSAKARYKYTISDVYKILQKTTKETQNKHSTISIYDYTAKQIKTLS